MIYSKILSATWPHFQAVSERCVDAYEFSVKNKNSDDELRKAFCVYKSDKPT